MRVAMEGTPAELALVTQDRRRILLAVLPVAALACGLGSVIIGKGPSSHAFDPYMFGAAALVLLAIWGLSLLRRIAYWPAATATVVVTGGLVMARMASLFTGASAQDPDVSLMNSIFAYFPIYFTLLTILLPYPRSARYGVCAWLVVAGFVSWMTAPFWRETPLREGLLPLLTLIWAGYPIFLMLVAGAARRHARMVRLYADEAAAAQAANRNLSALHDELEQRIEARTRELQISNARRQSQNDRLQLVTELSGRLASARGEAEARQVAAQFLPGIFAGTSGTLYLAAAPGGDYVAEFSWGDPSQQPKRLTDEVCWTLRAQAQPDGSDGPHCRPEGAIHPGADHMCAPLSADGKTIGVLYVTNGPGAKTGAALPEDLMLRTVSEQLALALTNIRLRAELQAQATRDALTGLHNRRYLNEFLPRALAVAKRNREPLSVLVMDVDHFKRVNDLYGHETGDEVLIQTAAVLCRNLREGDLAFRYGGEEFVVVLPSCSAVDALTCAERIRRDVSGQRLIANGKALTPITLSVGVASLLEDGASMERLLSAADSALYRAKHEGRNCVRPMQRAA